MALRRPSVSLEHVRARRARRWRARVWRAWRAGRRACAWSCARRPARVVARGIANHTSRVACAAAPSRTGRRARVTDQSSVLHAQGRGKRRQAPDSSDRRSPVLVKLEIKPRCKAIRCEHLPVLQDDRVSVGACSEFRIRDSPRLVLTQRFDRVLHLTEQAPTIQ